SLPRPFYDEYIHPLGIAGNVETDGAIVVSLLTDLGMDDEEIQRILGLSYGAFRIAKYRIKKRALNK
ncbi:MAG: hypothetical protein ACOCNY_04575, partial [Prevotella sp.]